MSNKINIAYIIDELNIGGTEKQLLRTIELLNKDRFTPVLICLRPSDYFFRLDIQCEKLILNVYSLLTFDGFLKFCRLVFYLRKRRIDIVQTYFIDANVFGVLSAKLGSARRIVSCKRDLGFWYTSKLLRVMRVVNRFADRVLVNSNAVKEHIAKHECISSEKIDVIYNGVDIGICTEDSIGKGIKRQLGISDNDYIVGIVANLNRPVKRVDLFIKAAAHVVQKIKNVSFIIVGDGDLKNDLQKLAEDLQIRKQIYFAGLQENIHPYISIFDIGVISSDSEGFSNSILEYAASGIPIIATNVGGNRELLEKCNMGILVPKDSTQDMALGMITLLNDPLQMRRMSKNGRRIVKNEFDWKSKIREIERYYQHILTCP
jgi:glycosyltransferase involved in cell wall biosynthesis